MTEAMWEPIVELETPIPLSGLTVKVVGGQPFTLPQDRPGIYQEVLNYWTSSQIRMMIESRKELSDALTTGDEKSLAKIWGRTGANGLRHRLTDASIEGTNLTLEMGVATFQDYVGTNEQAIRNPDFRKRLMEVGTEDYNNPNAHFASPLAACSAIHGIGPDGRMYFAVSKRSEKVIIYPGVYHVFGGLVELGKDRTSANFGSRLAKELPEETGLVLGKELGEPVFMGLIRQGRSRIPEAILSVPVYVSQEELISRWQSTAPDKFESKRIEFYDVRDVPEFIANNQDMVPSGAAALDQVYQNRELLRLFH